MTEWWKKLEYEELDLSDMVKTYKGWGIFLQHPNGGILGVIICYGSEQYGCPTSFYEKGRYYDEDWHIELAVDFIDSLQNTGEIPQGLLFA